MLSKLLLDQNPKDVYVFNDYRLTPEIKFDILIFNHKQQRLTAYMLVDNLNQFNVIVKQLDRKDCMNNFVDQFYIVVNDMQLARELESPINYITKDEDLNNIGLMYLSTNELTATIVCQPKLNDNYWFKHYVKSAEIRKLTKTRDEARASDLLHRANDYLYDDLSYQHEMYQPQDLAEIYDLETYPANINVNYDSEFPNIDQWFEESQSNVINNPSQHMVSTKKKQSAESMMNQFNNLRSNLLHSSEYYRKLEGITKCLNNLDDLTSKLSDKFNEE